MGAAESKPTPEEEAKLLGFLFIFLFMFCSLCHEVFKSCYEMYKSCFSTRKNPRESMAARNNRADLMNPNNERYYKARGIPGYSNKAALDQHARNNRSKQLNPNNWRYARRGSDSDDY